MGLLNELPAIGQKTHFPCRQEDFAMTRTKRVLIGIVALIAVSAGIGRKVFSHCQIPCGIYDDKVRIALLEEHINTIEKSMKQILALSKEDAVNYNQIVRWIYNKEHHAEEFSRIVTYYFMAQRIKPVAESKSNAYKAYVHKITLLHGMLIYAMKAKQTTDLAHVEKLRSFMSAFRKAYFGPKERKSKGKG
jgi:nickel superoxide dismutase